MGLARLPEGTGAQRGGWFRPQGLAASTHILKTSHLRDIPEIEFLCMRAAHSLGIPAAQVELLSYGRPVLAVKRFDRAVVTEKGRPRVRRLHQEDLAQAFGVSPGSKYAELEGGTVAAMAQLVRSRSARPLPDLEQLARTLCFNYLVGNCDAHLKNFSLLWGADDRRGLRLAPAYDLVCTTRFPRFSRNMAMSLGGVRDIDAVGPQEFADMARDLGIRPSVLRQIGRELCEGIAPALMEAAEEAGSRFESTPFIAEDLIADLEPRRAVLSHL